MSSVDVEKLEAELKGITIKEINEHPTKSREEISLDLFELASEKEQVGLLNDAAEYYWKAFKLDPKVDLKYREKYFGNLKQEESKQITDIKDKIKDENENEHKNKNKDQNKTNIKPLELNKNQLIKLLDSYSNCEFIAEDEEKPIFIQKLPVEVLQNIIEILLINDTPSWINLSMGCKKLSYIGFRDNNIWGKLNELVYKRQNYIENEEERFKYLIKNQWGFNYYKMLNDRPFLKFRGVYISKVSYMKEGARSENSNSWNLPYRIITYYRYYRFYADGTCLKMITVLEPKKVISKLHKGYKMNEDEELKNQDLLLKVNNDSVENFSNRNWLKIFSGNYKISLHGDVETNCNGPVEKYRFIDKFKITNTGKFHRHNKLEWVDLGIYDTIEDNYSSLNKDKEKHFVFSRVQSYQY